MQVLMPHISCVVSESEFTPALLAEYSDIYITTATAIFRHLKLSKGRYIRAQVPSVPGYTPVTAVKEELNFLPAGKLDYRMLEEIIQFFRDVMNIKKADQEAMAHILWNETEGYHISIPNQTVSKASARYEFDHIKKGDVIVLDIHSHNTMGAFFSGTDNTDDRKFIGYSGVAGNLDKRDPALIWRFNLNELKRDCKIDEIFNVERNDIVVPKEWLEKVKTQSYGVTTYGGQGKPYQGYGAPGYYGGQTHVKSKRERKEEKRLGKESGGNHSLPFGSGPGIETDEERAARFANYMDDNGAGFDGYPMIGIEEMGSPDVWEDTHMSPTELDEAMNQKGLSPKDENARAGSDLHEVYEVGEYDANVINFGKEAADAHEQVDDWIVGLEDCDELLLDIMKTAYNMLTTEAQGKLATTGF